MDKMTLRRIGWVGVSLGLTTALVGCNDVQSGEKSAEHGYSTSSSAENLDMTNGLGAVNGLNGTNGLNAANGLNGTNGLNSANGLGSVNGLNGTNGFNGT